MSNNFRKTAVRKKMTCKLRLQNKGLNGFFFFLAGGGDLYDLNYSRGLL